MREYTYQFQKGFTLGLRPSPSFGQDQESLLHCLNLVPSPTGLEPRREVTNPLQLSLSPSHSSSLPYLYIGKRYILLFTESGIFEVDENWETSLLFSARLSEPPQVADFFTYLIMSCPESIFTYDGGEVKEMGVEAIFDSCLNFRGQLIVGNAYLPNGPSLQGREVVPNSTEVGGEGVVGWTKIGAVDWEYTLGNEVGWAPIPWIGQILGFATLGNQIITFGRNGVAKLTPQTEPVTTFGVTEYGHVGPLSRQCWAGDDHNLLYLGADYSLYMITQERALSAEGKYPARLGYVEYMRGLEEPVVRFDPIHRHWWIGDRSHCYIFTGSGMGEATITPTSLFHYEGSLVGYYHRHGGDYALVATSPLSFGYRGLKQLMCVMSDLRSEGKVRGLGTYRYRYERHLNSGKPKLLDPRGAFFPLTAGTDLGVVWKMESFRGTFLSKAIFQYKNTDRTFIRGASYAGTATEQADS